MKGNINNIPDYENLKVIHRNVLPERAYFIPAANYGECRESGNLWNRERSSRMLALSGKWRFRYYSSVFDAPDDVCADSGGYDVIDVPSCWQSIGYGSPTYLNIRYQIPAIPPKVPNDNPVGIYKKRFRLEAARLRNTVILTFCGVSSGFTVYLNGEDVGYSQGSHNMSEFDVTGACREGENELTVAVYQFTDGSYLESQDHFRNSGIFRDVYLLFTEKSYVFDVFFNASPVGASLETFNATVDLVVKGSPCVAELRLEHDGKTLLRREAAANGRTEFTVDGPRLWNAEAPELYMLYVTVYDGETMPDGAGTSGGGTSCGGRELETVSLPVGFKHIEIKEGVFYFNGRNIKLRGVNRHDMHFKNGYTMTLGELEYDIKLLKRYNCNCVRTSHYPNDPRFLELCDRYGIYLVDEADLETHGATGMEYHDDWLKNWGYFTEHPDWKEAYVDRLRRMVARDRNHPCVTMWSLGNESGFLKNLQAMYDEAKLLDGKTPVHYESVVHCDIKGFDVVSRMYPDFNLILEHLGNKDEPPFFLCEYVHGQGPAPGGLERHWEIIYGHDKALGGCVWEMTDHSAVAYGPDGSIQFRHGYGGDFGEGINDGCRCANGFFDPERNPRNAAELLKQVYRPVWASLRGVSGKTITAQLINRRDFTDTGDLLLRCELIENGVVVWSESMPMPAIPPHGSIEAAICADYERDSRHEYMLNLHTLHRDGDGVFAMGEALGVDQLAISMAPMLFFDRLPAETHAIEVSEGALYAEVRVGGLALMFDKRYGTISSILAGGFEYLSNADKTALVSEYSRPVAGPKLGFWRPGTWCDEESARVWERFGLNALETHVNTAVVSRGPGGVEFKVCAIYGAKAALPFAEAEITYTASANGTVKVDYAVRPLREMPAHLPRLGLSMNLSECFERIEYYGKGPKENYPDQQEAARFGLFESSVEGFGEMDIVPQEMGNRCETRYLKLSGPGRALTVLSETPFSMSVSRYPDAMIERARHPEELRDGRLTRLRIDSVTGPIGQSFCGYPAEEKSHMVFLDKELRHSFVMVFK